ncbi:YIP1 family protein [Nitrosopumilus sp.]|uniref:YIP1 family protein n=1 Tax=Nitrosopumilus sp. TaxID=2024843 RepID=UPI002930FEBF|nr:YIP1 family protein [Nitrosopumilus sp.]
MFYSPNAAFAEIRDNEEKYLAQSIGILVFSMALVGLIFVPIYLMVEPQLEGEITDDDDISAITELRESFRPGTIAIDLVMSLAAEVIFIVILFLLGKNLGGNTNWKKVFSVISHSYVIYLPVLASVIIFLFIMLSVVADARDQGDLFEPSPERFLALIGAPLAAMILVIVVFLIWNIIVIIKATKVVNGYGTLKAIGVLILATIVSILVQVPLGIF